MNLANYLENFQGRSGASSIDVADGELKRLPNQPCRFVMLANWNVTNTPEFNLEAVAPATIIEESEEEVYYGFNGVLFAPLIPTRTTDLLPVANCDQVCVRSRPTKSRVIYFAWFY
jgi:hypothetical protein